MRRLALALLIPLIPSVASAEMEYSLYTGYQSVQDAEIRGDGGTVAGDKVTLSWEGKPFEAPPYYGLRATWWQSDTFGFGIDLNHVKAYSDDDERTAAGYDILEYTDGLNILTVNAYKRFPELNWPVTPYLGAGVGVAIPHVEVSKGGAVTEEYQITGPAVALIAGASYPLSERVSVFGEYKGTYSQNEAELSDGGTLEADFVTNAVNVGLSLRF